MSIRLSQVILVALLGIYGIMICLNNILAPRANFIFVEKIMGMEDVFPHNPQAWRGVSHPAIQWGGFCLIAIAELLTGLFCLTGSYQMFRSRYLSEDLYDRAKKWARLGITLGILLWFGGFVIVGGEWFLSWQSENFDGVELGMRNGTFYLGVLIVVSVRTLG